jgi:hypothetical protein
MDKYNPHCCENLGEILLRNESYKGIDSCTSTAVLLFTCVWAVDHISGKSRRWTQLEYVFAYIYALLPFCEFLSIRVYCVGL